MSEAEKQRQKNLGDGINKRKLDELNKKIEISKINAMRNPLTRVPIPQKKKENTK